MISPDLLELLRCPITRQRLMVADDDVLARLNANMGTTPIHAALVRADGTGAYPVRDGIPLLLADEAMALS